MAVKPRATALAVTLRAASSRAMDFREPMTPAFEAAWIRLARVARHAHDARHVDDASVALLHHALRRGLTAAVERAP